ncbi:UDP-N-acetylmuramoyl-L-alanyl-D-glutamate--2,6-diaminopimelate ligase [Paenibacillus chitinolyticus]|uniref:UDP-N-acetylmuramoyl-L-alanyl-D-glutamate--2, 6-diaminopimelate ligase n=1 Tax=Paenibacillus chitinolyticus TaxID=79263 RepID=UPI002DB6A252|nr:UDP-N-acetylmuramoyl-L-alanyl-D-glutamate--2,6-diaminopimelate ligase [Paenibacillus chitinolyticus]MEC0246624.1 UDP-N-acetylmuramoyl-L-alanyl-D-glutamate--2,6-diaminopimelate ligase [Paenibacillus chitinolyticus]
MELKELASQLLICQLIGEETTEISGIATDSRQVRPGDLFVCVPGFVSDGHDFAPKAMELGAAALVTERKLELDVPQLIVKDARYAMSVLSACVYGFPSRKMKVIGITGTNGKTTTSFLVEHILRDQGFRTGLMGTISAKIGSEFIPMERTTMEASDLQRTFRLMADEGTDYCVMEVSSHALDLGRVKGVRFRGGVFTNLTQDHLDYHETMDKYEAAKGLLFSRMGNEFTGDARDKQYAVLNADDPSAERLAKLTSAEVITYGVNRDCDVKATNIRITAKGTEFDVVSFAGTEPMRMKLVGLFNVYNALAAISVSLAEGLSLSRIRESLGSMPGVDGRMEIVDEGQEFLVLVDYAHTPDGLRNALSSIREFAQGRVKCVFGCGGDRDRTKRPLMGKVTGELSDDVYVTSDNPRTEDPGAILLDIVPGLIEAGVDENRYKLLVDRPEAIQKAIEEAGPQDVVLIAGKGHETYQDIAGVKHDFDDRLIARAALRRLQS